MCKKFVKHIFFGLFVFFISAISVSTTILNPVVIENAPVSYCYNYSSSSSGLGDFLKGILNKGEKNNKQKQSL